MTNCKPCLQVLIAKPISIKIHILLHDFVDFVQNVYGSLCSFHRNILNNSKLAALWKSYIHQPSAQRYSQTWWRHQMETFSALLAICAGNSPVPGEFPTQGPVTRSFDVYFDMRPNKRLSKQWWGWWFETQSCPLWCHRNGYKAACRVSIPSAIK